MRIISFNVNGIRARLHQIKEVIDRHAPDIIGLQETKVCDEDFPVSAIEALGYSAEYFGEKGHYGVALLSRQRAVAVKKGLPGEPDNQQRRFLQASYSIGCGKLHVINGYFPQGENRSHPLKFPNKQRFYSTLLEYIQHSFSTTDYVVLLGDMNVALEDADIGIAPENAKRWLRDGKCAFLPEEREWLSRLKSWGFHDTFRITNPENTKTYSWFDYRSGGFERDPKRGLRIDLLLGTKPLIDRLEDAGIDYDIRAMEKPSDHCPVWAEFNLN